MFICKTCLEKEDPKVCRLGYQRHLTKTFETCVVCHELAVCADCQCSHYGPPRDPNGVLV